MRRDNEGLFAMNGCRIPRRGHAWLALAAVLLATAANAPAADLYWSGTGAWDTTTANWGTATGGPYDAATWSNETPDAASFEGTAGTVTLSEAITAAGLTFAVDGYTITTGTLTLSGTPTIAADTGISATIASILAGSDAIEKTGGGTLTLSAANTYSGGTTVSGGRIVLGTNTSLGSGTVTLNGGAIERNAIATVANNIAVGSGGGTIVARQTVDDYTTLSGQLTGSGPLTLDGLVNLSGTGGTYSGTITLADATSYVRFSSATALATTASLTSTNGGFIRLDGNTVELASVTSNAQVFTVGVGAVSRLRVGAGAMSGQLVNGAGELALEKVGPGTLTLSGNNTYTGGTTISGGTVVIGNLNAFGAKAGGDVSRVVVTAGGAVDFNGVGMQPTATRSPARVEAPGRS